MKLTFNILNQRLGENPSFLWFIDALRLMGVKEEKHYISGFVTWNLNTGSDIDTAIDFKNTTIPIPDPLYKYSDMIAGICEACLSASPIEAEKYGQSISKLEYISCNIKSQVEISGLDAPFQYSVTDEQTNEESIISHTWDTWSRLNTKSVQDADGNFYFPLLVDTGLNMVDYLIIYNYCISEGYDLVSDGVVKQRAMIDGII